MTHYIENYNYPYKIKGSGSHSRTAEKLTGLTSLSHFLVGMETKEDLIQRATTYIPDYLVLDYCKVFVLDSDGHFCAPCDHLVVEESVEHVFQQVTSSTKTQRPSSLEQVLDPQCRAALGLKIRDCHWIVPLKVEETPIGVLVLAKHNSTEIEAFPKEITFLVDLIADQLSSALHRKLLNQQLEKNSIEMVLALSKTLETRDPNSGEHSKHLAFLSEQLAGYFNLSSHETMELYWAALLHDIGKIGIEDSILHKPGPLTRREWDIMRSHSEIGAHIVQGVSGLEQIAPIILAHHERVDGMGYPHHLKDIQIPLAARIIAVVDSYSAMTEGRVYREARSHEEAITELIACSGKMYDPEVVKAFIQLFDHLEI